MNIDAHLTLSSTLRFVHAGSWDCPGITNLCASFMLRCRDVQTLFSNLCRVFFKFSASFSYFCLLIIAGGLGMGTSILTALCLRKKVNLNYDEKVSRTFYDINMLNSLDD